MTNNQQTNPVTPVDLAAMVEARVHESLSEVARPFDLGRARLYGVNFRGDDLQLSFVLEHGDIYQLLEVPESACARMFDAAALVTCGWAAPIAEGESEPEGAPSAHPQRRRVRLVVVVADAGVASVLRFEDESDVPIFDAGEARGPLAEAIAGYWTAD
ncbi:MAG: hypothetical protein EBU67_08300 [Actinobacteria bacterium]|nr:hypothetical protein [Actinomycetota bacterium]NBP54271.1 hypothetical protein [Actinomycetota bacterium]